MRYEDYSPTDRNLAIADELGRQHETQQHMLELMQDQEEQLEIVKFLLDLRRYNTKMEVAIAAGTWEVKHG